MQSWWKQIREQAVRTPAGDRIVAELEYLGRLPDADGSHEAVEEASAAIREAIASDGAVVPETCRRIEESLAAFGPRAKQITLHCAAHAHLDMNWMWGYDETVVIVLETMRTVLRLLSEYPEFRFSQSQASVYRIIEEFEPELLARISPYVETGRWELAATQWTETDMNLPVGESLLRHGLYTINYLRELFPVDRERLRVVFMPDTFGHSAATPEILAECGVHYLYHGRGSVGPFLSRWGAPSGRSVLAYQDPRWYNEDVGAHLFAHAAQLASEYGMTKVLSVYGVGDHGGGPTRRDIETLMRMREWPLSPTIRFSTYHEFFRAVESTPGIPEVTGERNPIFSGCYSSQSRIKAGNRRGERALFVSEVLGALSGTLLGSAGGPRTAAVGDAWRDLLFNHFHDILPGSGVTDTRTYAMGLYQGIHARTQVETSRAMRALAAAVAPSVERHIAVLIADVPFAGEAVAEDAGVDGARTDTLGADRSEGAGVGFGVASDRAAPTGRWGGVVRPFLVVNPLPLAREEIIELTVWDYPDTPIQVVDAAGAAIPHQIVKRGTDAYWGHTYCVILVSLSLGAWQQRVLFVAPGPSQPLPAPYHPYGVDNWLVETHPELILDNGVIRLEIDPESLTVRSLVDRKSGGTEALGEAGARFCLEYEEPGHMTSWLTRRVTRSTPVGAGGRVRDLHIDPAALRQWIELELPFGASKLRLRLELDAGSNAVRVSARTSFRETYDPEEGVPRLVLAVDPAAPIEEVVSDIPVGTIVREPDGLPRAAQSFCSVEVGGRRLTLVGRDSQSYAADERTLRAILLRGSGDPDRTPEVGEHEHLFLLSPRPAGEVAPLIESQVVSIERPEAAGTPERTAEGGDAAGEPALDAALAAVETRNVSILAVKPAEHAANAIVIRCAAADETGTLRFRPEGGARAAEIVDACEEGGAGSASAVSVSVDDGGTVTAEVSPHRIATVLVYLSQAS